MIWSGLIDTNCLIRFSSPPYCKQVCSTSTSSNNAVKEALDMRFLWGLGMVGNLDVWLWYLLICCRTVTFSHVTKKNVHIKAFTIVMYHSYLHIGIWLLKYAWLMSPLINYFSKCGHMIDSCYDWWHRPKAFLDTEEELIDRMCTVTM